MEKLKLEIEQKILSIGQGENGANASIVIKIDRPGLYMFDCYIPYYDKNSKELIIQARISELEVG
jgi:hypothetical protein